MIQVANSDIVARFSYFLIKMHFCREQEISSWNSNFEMLEEAFTVNNNEVDSSSTGRQNSERSDVDDMGASESVADPAEREEQDQLPLTPEELVAVLFLRCDWTKTDEDNKPYAEIMFPYVSNMILDGALAAENDVDFAKRNLVFKSQCDYDDGQRQGTLLHLLCDHRLSRRPK